MIESGVWGTSTIRACGTWLNRCRVQLDSIVNCCEQFVHCREVVHSSECPFSEVPLFFKIIFTPPFTGVCRSFTGTMKSLSGGKKKWTTKLSSAGLVYLHFGHRVLSIISGIYSGTSE